MAEAAYADALARIKSYATSSAVGEAVDPAAVQKARADLASAKKALGERKEEERKTEN